VDLDYQLNTAMTQILVPSIQNFFIAHFSFLYVPRPYKGRFETPKYSPKINTFPHWQYLTLTKIWQFAVVIIRILPYLRPLKPNSSRKYYVVQWPKNYKYLKCTHASTLLHTNSILRCKIRSFIQRFKLSCLHAAWSAIFVCICCRGNARF